MRPAAITCLLVLLSVVRAPAATFTEIVTPNPLGEPDLITILNSIYGVDGYVRVSDNLDTLWQVSSPFTAKVIGTYASSLGAFGMCIICDGSDDIDFTPSIPPNTKSELDLPLAPNSAVVDGIYRLFTDSFLDDPDPDLSGSVGRVFSAPWLNPGGVDHMVTFRVLGKPNTYIVAFEDWFNTSNYASDRDFNDTALEITAQAIPEPGSLALLGSGLLLGFSIMRRRSKAA